MSEERGYIQETTRGGTVIYWLANKNGATPNKAEAHAYTRAEFDAIGLKKGLSFVPLGLYKARADGE